MEDFKQYLNENPNDSERRALEKIEAGLEGLRLEKKVAEAAAFRQKLARRWFLKKTVALAIGLLILGAFAVLFFAKIMNPSPPVPDFDEIPVPKIEEKIEPQPSQNLENQSPAPVPEKPVGKKNVPIAERPLSKKEQFEKPLVRGVFENLDSATVFLISELLTETEKNGGDFQSNFDWKKAIQNLRDGQPNTAKPLIFNMEKQGAAFSEEAKWLLGISLLAEGKMDEARAIFEKIVRTAGHPRQAAAKMAVEKLQE